MINNNVQTALQIHWKEDPHFKGQKQLPEDKQNPPKMLFLKDNSILFDWTPGQRARYLMEDLRQGIHELQSADKASGTDIVAVSTAREIWPELRDISCHENPGIRFYDLDGVPHFCPTK
jgi:hypothetical protein